MPSRNDGLGYVRVDQLVLGNRLLSIFFCFLALAITASLLATSIPAGGPAFLQKGTVFLNFATGWSLPGLGLAVMVPLLAIFDTRLTTFVMLVYLAPTAALGLYQVASAAYAYYNALTGLFEFAALVLTFIAAAAEVVALGFVAVLYRDQTRLGWGPLITAVDEAERVRATDEDAAGVEVDDRRSVPLTARAFVRKKR